MLRSIGFFRLFIVVLIIAAWSYGFYEIGRASVYSAHPELSGNEQATAILSKVSKLIQLPSNETPTMATITDAAAAKKAQPFLANAQNGDVLIVYTSAQEALLYRPSSNVLITVGPVDTQGAAQVPSSSVTTIDTSPANETATTSSKNAKSTK